MRKHSTTNLYYFHTNVKSRNALLISLKFTIIVGINPLRTHTNMDIVNFLKSSYFLVHLRTLYNYREYALTPLDSLPPKVQQRHARCGGFTSPPPNTTARLRQSCGKHSASAASRTEPKLRSIAL